MRFPFFIVLVFFFIFCFVNMFAERTVLLLPSSPGLQSNGGEGGMPPMLRKKLEPAEEGNAFQRFASKVNSALIRFIGKVEMLSRAYQKEPSLKALALVIGFSFLYGVLHVVGPGHGKTVLTSYLISRRISLRKGLAMAGGVAFSHILMAVLIVFLLFIIFQAASISNVESAKKWLTYVSGALILGIGTFFLIQAVRELFHKHTHEGHDHSHEG
ncbi:MAG: hypothetical protein JNM63_16105, partial [Spirochaetia bacterium]|nr:hypothetical protein [Spirochaetia bacterium]